MSKIELPSICYTKILTTGEIAIIKKGESGYHELDYKELRTVDELNESIGVSPMQEKAMLIGSMFGWYVPGADPNNYNSEGKCVIRED